MDAVNVEGLWKEFRLYHDRQRFLKAALLKGRRARFERFWALSDVNFSVASSECVGVIGRNGSGKSTLLKCLAGTLSPDRGSASTQGRVVALLELGAGFQPELSGRENIFLNAAIFGLRKREIQKIFDDIVDFSELGRFIDTPVKNYSSGMAVRLGFSIAAHVEPEVLIVDEVLSVGDQSFQEKCIGRIRQFKQSGATILVVTHGLSLIQDLCERSIWLDGGAIKADGSTEEVIRNYLTTSSKNSPPTATKSRPVGGLIKSVQTLESSAMKTTEGGLTLEIEVERSARSVDIELVTTIFGPNGLVHWASSTRNDGLSFPDIRRLHRARLEVAPVAHPPGRYVIALSLRDLATGSELDRHEHAGEVVLQSSGVGDPGVRATWISCA